MNCDSSLPSRKVRPRTTEKEGLGDSGGKVKGWDRQAGGRSGGGRMTGRRTTNSFLGGDDGGRIQGEDMRSRTDQMEGGAREKTGGAGQIRWREEPGRRQEGLGAGGVRWDPGRSNGGLDGGKCHGGARVDDSRGPTDGGRAGGDVVRGGDGEPKSQGNAEDPEGNKANAEADDSSNQGGGRDPEGFGAAGRTEG